MASSKIQASSPVSEGQVALALYKPPSSPALPFFDIPQGADAVEKGIFLMGDIGRSVISD